MAIFSGILFGLDLICKASSFFPTDFKFLQELNVTFLCYLFALLSLTLLLGINRFKTKR